MGRQGEGRTEALPACIEDLAAASGQVAHEMRDNDVDGIWDVA